MPDSNNVHLHQSVTDYFTGLARAYAQYRPSYPVEAIDWMLESSSSPLHVADIGCGTGISTRLLAMRKSDAIVIGIDPNPDMLVQAQSESTTETIQFQAGTGERTGLPDSSAHVVVCAQSFHWFDQLAALREFHRILQPAGRLALMWNVKDDDHPFSAAFGRVAKTAQADTAQRGRHVPLERATDPTMGEFFANVRMQSFPNPQTLTLESVIGRARSASYFPKSGPVHEALETELRQAFAIHQNNGHVVLMHQTEVTLADRLA